MGGVKGGADRGAESNDVEKRRSVLECVSGDDGPGFQVG